MHFRSLAFASLACFPNYAWSKYTFSTEKDEACTAAEKATILAETKIAHEIATYAATNADAHSSVFLNAFFPTGAKYTTAVKTVFKSLADIADQSDTSGYIVDVTCRTTKKCTGDYILHMDDIYTKGKSGKTVATMNFCPGSTKFFNTLTTGDTTVIDTTHRVAELQAAAKGGDTAGLLRLAHRSRAVGLVHELTHTNYATSAGADEAPAEYQERYSMAKDFAYGLPDCLRLAADAFERAPGKQVYALPKSSVYCGASAAAGGTCPAAVAMINADSYALLAAGVWFSQQIGTVIPVPACTTTTTASSKRFGTMQVRVTDASCKSETVDVIDDPTDQGAKVAAF